MKKQILQEIEKHLSSLEKEIVNYSYSLVLTTISPNDEYLHDVITISKNYNNGVYTPYTSIKL